MWNIIRIQNSCFLCDFFLQIMNLHITVWTFFLRIMNLYLAILIFFPQNYEFISCNSYLFLRIMNIDLAVLNFFLRIMNLYLAITTSSELWVYILQFWFFFSKLYIFILQCWLFFTILTWKKFQKQLTFWHFSHFCELISCDSVAMTFFLFCLPVAETSFHRKQSSKEHKCLYCHFLNRIMWCWTLMIVQRCSADSLSARLSIWGP